jgi:citrate synthase
MVEVRVSRDVVAADSSICYIDGAAGILSYRGIDIHEPRRQRLSSKRSASFSGRRLAPTPRSSEDARGDRKRNAPFRRRRSSLLERVGRNSAPMDALRTVVSSLSASDPDARDMSPEANRRKAVA